MLNGGTSTAPGFAIAHEAPVVVPLEPLEPLLAPPLVDPPLLPPLPPAVVPPLEPPPLLEGGSVGAEPGGGEGSTPTATESVPPQPRHASTRLEPMEVNRRRDMRGPDHVHAIAASKST
jgi:hypothetical protein